MSKNYVKEYKGHKVPEGAVYYNAANECFYNNDKTCFSYIKAGCMGWSNISDDECARNAIELPEEPSQDWVDGLPPVGCELLMGGDWCRVLIIGNDIEGKTVIQVLDDGEDKYAIYTSHAPRNFRPLKSQEEKDREAFIDCVMGGVSADVKDAHIVHNVAEQLFNAGFKAPEDE